MKKILLSMTLTLFAVTPVSAATYTVKNDGTGNYTSIQSCVDSVQPGDTCLVSNGTYNGATINKSGTSGKRITIKADPSGSQPIITGNINFTNESYITVDGLYMDGSSFAGANCSFIEILNNTIDKSGLGIGEISPGTDILISGNTFRGLNNDVVRQFGSRWVIRNNIATDMTDLYDDHFDFWQSWCGTRVPADYALVENNLFADISGPNVHFFLFHETTTCGTDKGTNFIIRHNKVRNIGSNGVTFDNDTGAPGFEGVAIYNNTFMQLSNGAHATWRDYIGAIDDASGSKFFYNNLLYDAVDPTGAEAIYPTSVPADNTLVFDPDYTVTVDGALRNSSGSIINKDPSFTDAAANDFSLNTGSPAVDSGRALTAVTNTDSGSGFSLIVESPWFFQDGWAGVDADWIAVGDPSNVVQIASINYATNTLTLASSISRSGGDPVYLYRDSDGTQVIMNSIPDIGAHEYNPNPTAPTAPAVPSAFKLISQ